VTEIKVSEGDTAKTLTDVNKILALIAIQPTLTFLSVHNSDFMP